MAELRVKLLHKHRRDCSAMNAVERGDWKTPWTGHEEHTVWRDKLGRKSATTTMWMVVRCNSVGCPATAMVNCEDIALAIHEALPADTREGE